MYNTQQKCTRDILTRLREGTYGRNLGVPLKIFRPHGESKQRKHVSVKCIVGNDVKGKR